MKRIPLVCIVAALAFVTGSCGGNSTLDDSPSSVVLTVAIGPSLHVQCVRHSVRQSNVLG